MLYYNVSYDFDVVLWKKNRLKYICVLQDHVLIELAVTGLEKKSKRDEDTLVKEDDPFLVVHPNYVID